MTAERSEEIAEAMSEDSPLFLSNVIPAHNEEFRLPGTLVQIREFLDEQTYRAEVVVVENASNDETWAVANAMAERDPCIHVLRESIRGKGAAVRQGMLAAKGSFRFLCDADLSMPIEELRNFLPPSLEGIEVAMGSREAAGAIRFEEPGRRHLMGRVFNALVRTLLIDEVEDTQCGFKCFRAEAADEIFSRVTRTGFCFYVEALVIARRFGYQMVEVPVHWRFDRHSRVRMVRDTAEMIFDVFLIWLRVRRGSYDR
jgi:dolichyl-phosphate beta-glucosyltransferase